MNSDTSMVKVREFMTLPTDVRNKISDFIQEYIDVDKVKGFDQNGELIEKVYRQAFVVLVTKEVFTVKELRKTLFEDYHVLLPIEWFSEPEKTCSNCLLLNTDGKSNNCAMCRQGKDKSGWRKGERS